MTSAAHKAGARWRVECSEEEGEEGGGEEVHSSATDGAKRRKRRRRVGKDKGKAGESTAGEFGRTAKSVAVWQRHKEPRLSIQLCSTPLWHTCHHRLCLHRSVHCREPCGKWRVSCRRCDVRDEQLSHYEAFFPGCLCFMSF